VPTRRDSGRARKVWCQFAKSAGSAQSWDMGSRVVCAVGCVAGSLFYEGWWLSVSPACESRKSDESPAASLYARKKEKRRF
jgi:hypothetical protein